VEKVPGIQRAVVVAAGESRRGPRLVAVCLPRQDTEVPEADAIRKSCFDLLPHYAVPDEVRIVEALPHLPSGKVDRRAVRELVTA
jgi:acyl-CoA synthetase (AMP-forming)/AMP-acid ligase II